MKIGELARRTDTNAETIRYYEREGLLGQPARSAGNYRLYTPDHLERLTFIRHCRSLHMTLDEIRALLRFQDAPRKNCREINEVLDGHLNQVAARIRDLRHLQRELKILRRHCEEAQRGIDNDPKGAKPPGTDPSHGTGPRASGGRRAPRSVRI